MRQMRIHGEEVRFFLISDYTIKKISPTQEIIHHKEILA